jgi:LmbE family N-acetylglucosaminyl deacetylase
VEVTETIDLKIEALKQHASQLGDWDPTEMVKEWNAEVGKEKGLVYAESYRVITMRRPPGED